MKPIFVETYQLYGYSDEATDNQIDELVRKMHDDFCGSVHPCGCGIVTFYGYKNKATADILTSERRMMAVHEWVQFIEEEKHVNRKYHAMSETVFVPDNDGHVHKRTYYINSNKSYLTFIDTQIISADAYKIEFGMTNEELWHFSRCAWMYSPIYEVLGVDV